MPSFKRSTTGCAECKTRRKKCDETKPRCLRCLASGKTCHYEYVEYALSQGHRVKRTKPAPRSLRELLAKKSQAISVHHYGVDITTSLTHKPSGVTPTLARPAPPKASCDQIYSDSGLTVSRGADGSLSLLPTTSISSCLPSDMSLVSSSVISPDLVQIPTTVRPAEEIISRASISTSQEYEKPDLEEAVDEDNDPEGIQALVCRPLTMDKNVKDNTLPFVLHCYSQWAITSVFDPLKVTHKIREQVIVHFSSERTRTRTILIANVMEMFVKNFKIDGARKSILDRLALDVQRSGSRFMSTPPSFVPALDRQQAIRTFDSMIEILTLQLRTQPMSNFLRSLENTAPVFRRACLDPPGRPVNLPNLLLDLSPSLRYFPTVDIIKHLTTGLPTCFRYEVPFSIELCEQVYQWQLQGNYGLQWLYGLPDQLLLLFAWINCLSETPEGGDNSQRIAWIEKELPQIKVAIDSDESSDPSLRLQRMVVQESWRYAVLIYLYMVLCKVDAYDPRVRRAQQGYMRLIRNTKPGRRPDVHLCVSMVMAGLATTEELDRTTIRRRILGVRERAVQGTAANDLLLRLEDIWTRTRDEGRVAVWSDLEIACSRLASK